MPMYRDTLKNTMNFETEDCQVFISCDKMQLFNELHDAIDRVLMKYYGTQILESSPVDAKAVKELEEIIDKMNEEK